jgi:hypothetical protein
MTKTKVWLIVLGSVVLLGLEKSFFPHMGLVIEGPLFVWTLWLIVKYRASIAAWFKRIPVLPTFIVAIISTFPFMLFEENLNCLPSGCVLVPPTIPFLTGFVVFFVILFSLIKIKSIKIPVIVFSIFGLWVEFFYGVGVKELWALPPHWFIFFIFWIAISYAYFAIIPFEIIKKEQLSAK